MITVRHHPQRAMNDYEESAIVLHREKTCWHTLYNSAVFWWRSFESEFSAAPGHDAAQLVPAV
jgi:hypothetical protein